MPHSLRSIRAFCPLALVLLAAPATAEDPAPALKCDLVFSSHMVLQRDQPIRVSGTGAPGKTVAVTIGGSSATATIDAQGKWRVKLPAMKADGKSHTLTVASRDEKIELTDIQIGEVWLLAGQSNMAAGMGKPKDAVPGLRLMSIDHNRVYGWHPATPDNVQKMPWRDGSKRWRSVSHVAYHFGRHLHEKLGVPVGVMHADHGGSIIAAWMTDTVKTDWPELPGGKPVTGNLATLPGNLYRYKVKKAAPLTIRGVVWWQGESDGRNANYGKDLQSMTGSWRELFGLPKLPFILIQIAPNTYASGPLRVWEAQSWAARNIDGIYLAPNQDAWVDRSKGIDKATGWPTSGGNPHPPAKDRAARRAADIVRQLIGQQVGHEVFGPIYASHKIAGDKIVVTFDHVGDGLKSRDDQPLNWFEISDGTPAGNDLRFVKATAKVVGKNEVEVSSPEVRAPEHVRYGWSPVTKTNLVNSVGLPAITFRTHKPQK